jgi:hypothetical protein
MIKISYELNASVSCPEVHWLVPNGAQFNETAAILEKKNRLSILRGLGYTENIRDPVDPFASIFRDAQSFNKRFLTAFFDLAPDLPNLNPVAISLASKLGHINSLNRRLIDICEKKSLALKSLEDDRKFAITLEANSQDIIDTIRFIEDIPTIPSFIWHDTPVVESDRLINILEHIEPALDMDRNIFPLSQLMKNEILLFDNNPNGQDHSDYVICKQSDIQTP